MDPMIWSRATTTDGRTEEEEDRVDYLGTVSQRGALGPRAGEHALPKCLCDSTMNFASAANTFLPKLVRLPFKWNAQHFIVFAPTQL